MDHSTNKKAIVIGGSLGGLFTANLLRKIGWKVEIYERSQQDLDSRGGGIVLQPEVVHVFNEIGVNTKQLNLGVQSKYRTTFEPDGSIASQTLSPQKQTSWSLLYTTMKDVFGVNNYHRGKTLIGIDQSDKSTVVAEFKDGTQANADLLIGADGNGSTVRNLLWPEYNPTYAGYIAWRGLVNEADIPAVAAAGLVGDFGFANNKNSHILGYLVPGENNNTQAGERFYNWVWYRTADDAELKSIMTDINGKDRGFSIPEGKLSSHWIKKVVNDAKSLLPPNFRAMVLATKQPFAQAIRDLKMDTMHKGRVALVGDAAFIPRPHTAASTSKAASNALALAIELERHNTLDDALLAWEPEQIVLGNHLYRYGTRIGNHLMFSQR